MSETDTRQLSIADGLRKIKAIEKKLPVVAREITKYCSKKKGSADVIPEQKKHVESLIQKYKDLAKEWNNIKLAIQSANLETNIKYKGREMSLAEAILWKGVVNRREGYARGGAKEFERNLLNAFNTSVADADIGQMRSLLERAGTPQADIEKANFVPERVGWDEIEVQEAKEFLMDLEAELDAIIDQANVNTMLKL
jgi:hypothetical protein